MTLTGPRMLVRTCQGRSVVHLDSLGTLLNINRMTRTGPRMPTRTCLVHSVVQLNSMRTLNINRMTLTGPRMLVRICQGRSVVHPNSLRIRPQLHLLWKKMAHQLICNNQWYICFFQISDNSKWHKTYIRVLQQHRYQMLQICTSWIVSRDKPNV